MFQSINSLKSPLLKSKADGVNYDLIESKVEVNIPHKISDNDILSSVKSNIFPFLGLTDLAVCRGINRDWNNQINHFLSSRTVEKIKRIRDSSLLFETQKIAQLVWSIQAIIQHPRRLDLDSNSLFFLCKDDSTRAMAEDRLIRPYSVREWYKQFLEVASNYRSIPILSSNLDEKLCVLFLLALNGADIYGLLIMSQIVVNDSYNKFFQKFYFEMDGYLSGHTRYSKNMSDYENYHQIRRQVGIYAGARTNAKGKTISDGTWDPCYDNGVYGPIKFSKDIESHLSRGNGSQAMPFIIVAGRPYTLNANYDQGAYIDFCHMDRKNTVSFSYIPYTSDLHEFINQYSDDVQFPPLSADSAGQLVTILAFAECVLLFYLIRMIWKMEVPQAIRDVRSNYASSRFFATTKAHRRRIEGISTLSDELQGINNVNEPSDEIDDISEIRQFHP